MEPAERSPTPRTIQWFIDTRPLWPVPKQEKAQDEVAALKTVASAELTLLSSTEQASVLAHHHIRDAKAKLASHLLKHFVITRYAGVPWHESLVSYGPKGKPFFQFPSLSPSSSPEQCPRRVDFNISHQAGLVSLIAAVGYVSPVDVGTDIVCVSERREQDNALIDREGVFKWVDKYADVFAAAEVSEMKLAPLSSIELGIPDLRMSGFGRDVVSRCQWRELTLSVEGLNGDGEAVAVEIESDVVVESKRRRFYASWCLREAWVKMTGEGFAASWLRELEILGVEAPRPGVGVEEGGENGDLRLGEVKRGLKVLLKGRLVEDVKMELSALGEEYMIAGAVRVPRGECIRMGSWVELDLKDVLELAGAS